MSLERVLEPEVMDTVEDARDYDEMDHAAVNTLFIDDFLNTGFEGTGILDLGTGPARIPVELCARIDGVRVMAVDAAASMLERARFHVEQAGLQDRVVLQQIDAKQLPWEDGMFDAVVSNSIVHHIPQPLDCLREAVRVTRPGGTLFFRDLMRPDNRQQLEDIVHRYAGQENARAQQLFSESLLAALTLDEIRELVRQLNLDPAGVTQTSDRHWTWTGQR